MNDHSITRMDDAYVPRARIKSIKLEADARRTIRLEVAEEVKRAQAHKRLGHKGNHLTSLKKYIPQSEMVKSAD